MVSQKLLNVLSSIRHNNFNGFRGSRKLFVHHRKVHSFNDSVLRVHRHKKSNIKCLPVGTAFCNNVQVKHLNTDIITAEKIVKSPYDDVTIPDCLLHQCIWQNVNKWPDKIAIESGVTGKKYTFSQLRNYARNFAASLLKSGLRPGQVLSIILPNVPEYPIVLFGAMEAGLIVSPANPAYTADEICHQLSDSNSVCVVTFADKLNTVKDAIAKLEQKLKKPAPLKVISIQDYDGVSRELPPGVWSLKEMFQNDIDTTVIDSVKDYNIKSADIALLPYSSGTTGLPKGVCLTHHNIVSNTYQLSEKHICMNQEPEGNYQDVSPVVLPYFHIYGFVIILCLNLRFGGKMVSLPKFDPDSYIKILNSQKSTILYTVPPLVIFLGSHPGVKKEQFERVRFSLSAAAPVGISDIERMLVNFPKDAVFKQCYGLTETSPVVLMCNNNNNVLTSVGPPTPLTEAKVIDVNTGKNLDVDEHGEICVYGPQIMKGYLNRPEATAEMIDKDGWLHTGDIGCYDKDGNFYIVDRIKELIKVKGYQVAPAELEEILRSHPKIADAAVVGVPDKKSGEVPIAYVVSKPGQESVPVDEIKNFVAGKVTKYKQLADIIFTDQIPKNPSGKILRRKLRDSLLKR